MSSNEDNLAQQQALHQQIHNLLPSPYTKSSQSPHPHHPSSLSSQAQSHSQSTPAISAMLQASPNSTATPRLRSITPTMSVSSAPTSVAPMPVANLVMNRQADSDKSLYNMCKAMRDRFQDMDQIKPFLEDPSAPSAIVPITRLPPSIPLDPVTQLWAVFRLGAPLCILFNMLEPRNPLTVDPNAAANRASIDVRTCKRSVYDFVQGCKAELGYSDDELFTISNLFSDNTGDLIKVIRTVTMVMDALEARHVLPPKPTAPSTPPATRDARFNVVEELLQTELKYVQDLEVLHDYQSRLLEAEILNPDTIHLMFLNLPTLVDFQRRVLVGIEHMCSLPVEEQRFGALFLNMEAGFHIYEPYALNQKASSDLAVQEAPKLVPLSHIIEPTYELQAFLIKPIQRICKYPLLLRQLIKVTSEDHPYASELLDGLEAIKRVTNSVNETQRRVENVSVIRDLCERCHDWKGHKIEDFGDLLYYGEFMVSKGDVEREYHVYLFETIILCCKEHGSTRDNKKGSKTMSLPSKKSQAGQPKSQLSLKGRIYIANVSNVVPSYENGYFLTISWSGDADIGSFTMRFRHEELLRQWEATITQLVNSYHQESYESHFSPLVESPISSRNSQQSSHLSEELDRLTLCNRSLSGPMPKLGPRQPSNTSINSGIHSNPIMMNHSSVSIASSTSTTINRARSASMPGFDDGGSSISSRSSNIKVRVQYCQDAFTLIVPAKVSYEQLIERVERKVRLCGKVVPAPLRIKYQDEDGDMVTIHSDEDIAMALEQKDLEQLNIWVA